MGKSHKWYADNIVIPFLGIIGLAMCLFMAPGKVHAQAGNVYGQGQAQIYGNTTEGIVLQVAIKRTEASWQAKTAGAGMGALIGAGVGNMFDAQSRALVNLLGATAGGVVGTRVAEAVGGAEAQEIVVGLKDPKTGLVSGVATIVQPAPFTEVHPNESVLLINTNGAVRVLKKTYDSAMLSAQR